jgi:hypothetical protein
MGSSALLHYFRNLVASRVSAVRGIIPPGYLVVGTLDTFRITSYRDGHNLSTSVLAEEP